jgi:hypothetical protein
MIDAGKVCLFIPAGLANFKLRLFERVGNTIGHVVRHDIDKLRSLPPDVIPFVGCTPALRPLVDEWRASGRIWGYWDRGYMRRVFATDLPRGENGGYYRWHLNRFQMAKIRSNPRSDRWEAMKILLWPWARDGAHIVVASPSPTYERFHNIVGCTARTEPAQNIRT